MEKYENAAAPVHAEQTTAATTIPAKNFLGSLYVFDDRVTMAFAEAGGRAGQRHSHWKMRILRGDASEKYVNCANGDCHRHFIICEKMLRVTGIGSLYAIFAVNQAAKFESIRVSPPFGVRPFFNNIENFFQHRRILYIYACRLCLLRCGFQKRFVRIKLASGFQKSEPTKMTGTRGIFMSLNHWSEYRIASSKITESSGKKNVCLVSKCEHGFACKKMIEIQMTSST